MCLLELRSRRAPDARAAGAAMCTRPTLGLGAIDTPPLPPLPFAAAAPRARARAGSGGGGGGGGGDNRGALRLSRPAATQAAQNQSPCKPVQRKRPSPYV